MGEQKSRQSGPVDEAGSITADVRKIAENVGAQLASIEYWVRFPKELKGAQPHPHRLSFHLVPDTPGGREFFAAVSEHAESPEDFVLSKVSGRIREFTVARAGSDVRLQERWHDEGAETVVTWSIVAIPNTSSSHGAGR